MATNNSPTPNNLQWLSLDFDIVVKFDQAGARVEKVIIKQVDTASDRANASEAESPSSGITDDRNAIFQVQTLEGLSTETVRAKLEQAKDKLDWRNTEALGRKFWMEFENHYEKRLGVLLWIAEELILRGLTIYEFCHYWSFSCCNDINAVFHYIDYHLIKKRDAKKVALLKAAIQAQFPQNEFHKKEASNGTRKTNP